MMSIIVSIEFALLFLVAASVTLASAVLDHMGYVNVRVWARQASRAVIYCGILGVLFIVTIIGILQAVGIGPGLPEWAQAVIIYSGASFIISIVPLEILRQYLVGRNQTELHCTDPENGDFGVAEVSTTDWKNAIVMNEDGEEINRSALIPVKSKTGREAYECIDYLPEENVIIATWLSDKTPTEVRARESAVRHIKGRSKDLATAGINVIAQREEISHEAALDEMLENIRMREKNNLESEFDRTDFEELLKDKVGTEEEADIENHAGTRTNQVDGDSDE